MALRQSRKDWRRDKQTQDRLRPANVDALHAFGLPSKGETRLNDHKNQEELFDLIKSRCRAKGLTPEDDQTNDVRHQLTTLTLSARDPVRRETSTNIGKTPEVDGIFMAMRKLREGIVASGRKDTFAAEVDKYIIKVSIVADHWESYQPALLHLLRVLHSVRKLSESDLQRYGGYLILDLACRQDDLQRANSEYEGFDLHNTKLRGILSALTHRAWIKFFRLGDTVDDYQRHLLRWAYGKMRQHAIDCLSKAYFTIERQYAESSLGLSWEAVRHADIVNWEEEGQTILIRKVKNRKP